ncbi:MAG: hypothetical protein WAK20_06915 [Candidatus Acidiferrum sp.]
MEHAASRHERELLFLCLCTLFCGGCLARKPPVVRPGPIAFAHPIVPAAISVESIGEAPDIPFEIAEPPKLVPVRSSPPKPRIAQTQPAEPAVVEKPADPVIVPDLSAEQLNSARSEAEHSLEIAEWNLSQVQGKPLNSSQEDVASKVRGFVDTARDAMKNSDWQRAKNLAKKAEVLSHELVASR